MTAPSFCMGEVEVVSVGFSLQPTREANEPIAKAEDIKLETLNMLRTPFQKFKRRRSYKLNRFSLPNMLHCIAATTVFPETCTFYSIHRFYTFAIS